MGLIEELRDLDEVSLIEVLDLTTEDIIDAFYDYIVENYEAIKERL